MVFLSNVICSSQHIVHYSSSTIDGGGGWYKDSVCLRVPNQLEFLFTWDKDKLTYVIICGCCSASVSPGCKIFSAVEVF